MSQNKWLGIIKGMLLVKYFHSNKSSFASVECHGDRKTVSKVG